MNAVPAPRVTLNGIARLAGVSVATVSRVLNGQGNVSAATRARVRHLLDEHGYQARASRRPESTGLIQVIFPGIDTGWEIEQLRGMESAAHDAGVGLAVAALGPGPADDLRRWVSTGRIDGVILAATSGAGPLAAMLDSLDIPVVALDPGTRAGAELPSIGAANWSGAFQVTRHLTALGHRRIGMVTGWNGLLCSRARLDGFRAALDGAGIEDDPGLIVRGDFSYEAGFAAAQGLLALDRPPTAIVASSDNIARGVIEAARRRGIAVPDELSVTGFDDIPSARWSSPPLTTVRQPLQDMGHLATGTVLRLARGKPLDTPTVELSTQLIIRESTAPPPRPRRR
ncbi:LacI family DNA-binding transcriptional regulator [Actinoplanes sp. NPDC049265]|uniref:LacI family DNA-binding transcriptional regulator n=1 Tax=Actinoplanes sp. NPDC049265 TaxID=3363902 RepID=UPI003716FD57